jgi:O-antigen/teichoic acid export membrane protein
MIEFRPNATRTGRLLDLLRRIAGGRLPDGRLARNTLWVLVARGLRLGIQTVYFVLIARALGAEHFGAFVGVLALVQILAPFANLGAGNLLVKNVAREPRSFEAYWGSALVLNAIVGALLLAGVTLLSLWVLPRQISIELVLLVCLAELFFATVLHASAQAFQALERMFRMALLEVTLSAARLAAVAVLLKSGAEVTAVVWGQYYLASTTAAAAIGVAMVWLELGRPRPDLARIRPELGEGFYFAAGLSSQSIHGNIDKTMLTRLASLDAAGIYGAAYRIVDVALQPVAALLYSSYARFFRHGAAGVAGTVRLARQLVPVSAVYSAVAAGAFFFAAPLAPWLLGESYAAAASALRWLALLPLLKSASYFAGDALTGAGHQRLRVLWIAIAAGGNFLLNLWLIPLYSWRGAAVATLLTETLLAVALWLVLARLLRAERRSAAAASAVPESAV